MTYIVIVTFNSMIWIDKCLSSCKDYPVVVVDNASNDGTVAFIKSNYSKVTVIEQDNNLGFGKANNIGISYALKQKAEHIFLLNHDAYLVDDVLEKMTEFQTKHKEYGIISPIHITGNKKHLDKGFAFYLKYSKNPDFYSDHVIGNSLKPIYNIPFINAAAWLVSRKCFLDIGGFDPLFFHYGEDENYCQRVLYHGYKIGVLPSTFIIHDRDNRPINKRILFSESYYQFKANVYKVRFADVNNETATMDYKNVLLNVRTNYIKSFLKFRFKEFRGYLKEYAMLKSFEAPIKISYNTSKIKGSHYLNV